MDAPPSIIDLFVRLALHLRSSANQQQEEQNEIHLSILKFNQSLNLDGNPRSRTRVLDAALSLSCVSALQVFEAHIEFLVKTIVSVVSSSIHCEVFCFDNEQLLRIGSSIIRQNCVQLLEMCDNVIPKLDGHGRLSHMLLHAVARLALSTSCYQYMNSLQPILGVAPIEGKSAALSKLFRHLPRELSLEKQEIPLRLIFWYLDPLILKQAISDVLQDIVERPFLCLADEFYQRMDWRAIVICLVFSPAMFIKIRTLLHNWFLMMGLASLVDLLVGLVSAVMDAISRPMWWGIPLELSSKLPFSVAYFPHGRKLLRILVGGFSHENFLHLVHDTCGQVPCARGTVQYIIEPSAVEAAAVEHKSLWALAINFPDWFFFASFMLFHGKSLQESFQSKCKVAGTPKVEQLYDKDSPSTAAARYIAWILSPISKSFQILLVDYLTKISECWKHKQFDLGTSQKSQKATSCEKKFKKLKILDDKESYSDAKEYDVQLIESWLRETQNMFLRYVEKGVNGMTSSAANMFYGHNPQQSVLLRKIPLGILIAYSSYLTEDGFELLLYYAASGRTFQHREVINAGLEHVKLNLRSQGLTTWTDECSKKDALAGTRLVFSLTDTIESISGSFFETEESAMDFVDQVKVKSQKYLIKCINRLIELNIEKDGHLMVRDLHGRLARWKHQGKELLHPKNVDDVMNVLSCTLSSLENQ